MHQQVKPPALKHGAFSKILILPGEDPAEFEKLRNGLILEYRPSGESERETIDEIARAMWQARRTGVYQHVKYLRTKAKRAANLAAVNEQRQKVFHQPPLAPPPDPQTVDEALLDLGDVIAFDYVGKEMDVDAKLQAKIDRLFRRFFQIKASKQIDRLAGPQVIENRPAEITNQSEPIEQERQLPGVESPPLQELDRVSHENK